MTLPTLGQAALYQQVAALMAVLVLAASAHQILAILDLAAALWAALRLTVLRLLVRLVAFLKVLMDHHLHQVRVLEAKRVLTALQRQMAAAVVAAAKSSAPP